MSDLEQRLDRRPDRGRPGRAVRHRSGVRGPGAGPPQATQPHRGGRRAAWPSPSGCPAPWSRSAATTGGARTSDRPTTATRRSTRTATTARTASRAWPAATNGRAGTASPSRSPTAGCTAASNDWCADGGRPGAPRIQRPGTVSELGHVRSGLDVRHHVPGDRQPRRLPVAGGAPEREGLAAGERQSAAAASAGCWSTVTTRTSTEAHLHPRLDACRSPATETRTAASTALRPDAANPPEGALSVCRYDERGQLEQSEALVGEDAGDAVRGPPGRPGAGGVRGHEPGEPAAPGRASWSPPASPPGSTS